MSNKLNPRLCRCVLLGLLIMPNEYSYADSVFDEPQWLVGVIATIDASVYAGVEDEAQVIPYLAWTTEHWHVGIDKISYEWQATKDLQLELLANPRFGSSAPKDRQRYGNIERDFALEAGGSISYGVFPFNLEGEVLADVSGTHNGYSIALTLNAELPFSRVEIAGSAGLLYTDQQLTQHLYGVTAQQATTQISRYSPAADLSFQAGIDFTRLLSARCALIAEITAKISGSESRRSPLTDSDVGFDSVIGVVYVF